MNAPTLRRGLPPLPQRMLKLPLDHRGYPTPWFVASVNGKRDFRIADEEKRVRAVKERMCWICGDKMGTYLAFVIGPMCAVNLNTSEPPCHRECAEYAAVACPFLILPAAEYRDANLPDDLKTQPHAIPGNPGACCIWITKSFKPYRTGNSWLIRLGEAVETIWYCEGKEATRAQIEAALERRLPALRKIATEDGPQSEALLATMIERTLKLLPA